MYQIGDFVVYGTTGVCTITSLGPLSMRGVDRERQYYTLEPMFQSGAVYVPAEEDRLTAMRDPMTRDEAEDFIRRIPGLDACPVQNFSYKQRSDVFTAALHANNCESLVGIIKAVERRKRGYRDKKQQYSGDNTFQKRAMDLLCGELAFALQIPLGECKERVQAAVRSCEAEEETICGQIP